MHSFFPICHIVQLFCEANALCIQCLFTSIKKEIRIGFNADYMEYPPRLFYCMKLLTI